MTVSTHNKDRSFLGQHLTLSIAWSRLRSGTATLRNATDAGPGAACSSESRSFYLCTSQTTDQSTVRMESMYPSLTDQAQGLVWSTSTLIRSRGGAKGRKSLRPSLSSLPLSSTPHLHHIFTLLNVLQQQLQPGTRRLPRGTRRLPAARVRRRTSSRWTRRVRWRVRWRIRRPSTSPERFALQWPARPVRRPTAALVRPRLSRRAPAWIPRPGPGALPAGRWLAVTVWWAARWPASVSSGRRAT